MASLRMLHAAVLGALPAVDAGPVGLEPGDVRRPRYEVELALEGRHPQAVDDVTRPKAKPDSTTDRDMQLVGRAQHRVASVVEFPPPLVRGHVNDQRVGRGSRQHAAEDAQRHASAACH
jgi:hypothetical protein